MEAEVLSWVQQVCGSLIHLMPVRTQLDHGCPMPFYRGEQHAVSLVTPLV